MRVEKWISSTLTSARFLKLFLAVFCYGLVDWRIGFQSVVNGGQLQVAFLKGLSWPRSNNQLVEYAVCL